MTIQNIPNTNAYLPVQKTQSSMSEEVREAKTGTQEKTEEGTWRKNTQIKIGEQEKGLGTTIDLKV